MTSNLIKISHKEIIVTIKYQMDRCKKYNEQNFTFYIPTTDEEIDIVIETLKDDFDFHISNENYWIITLDVMFKEDEIKDSIKDFNILETKYKTTVSVKDIIDNINKKMPKVKASGFGAGVFFFPCSKEMMDIVEDKLKDVYVFSIEKHEFCFEVEVSYINSNKSTYPRMV